MYALAWRLAKAKCQSCHTLQPAAAVRDPICAVYSSKPGMGNFESDEGQHFFSFLPRGQITNPRPHTFYTILLNFLFIQRNESIINVICF